jgi:hypothetical protein
MTGGGCEYLPSHDFVIDKREAAELFGRIDEPSSEMYGLMSCLVDLAIKPDERCVFVESLSQPEEELHEKDGSDSGDAQRGGEGAPMVEDCQALGESAGEPSRRECADGSAVI